MKKDKQQPETTPESKLAAASTAVTVAAQAVTEAKRKYNEALQAQRALKADVAAAKVSQ